MALKESHIGYDVPLDPSVGRFNAYYKGATSVVEKKGGVVTKRQVAYKDYDLMSNEARVLKGMESIHFPKVLKQEEDMIEIEDCGDMLTADNLPLDWKAQLIRILLELKANNIQHRDIKPDNLMLKDGVIKLIDFGWARFKDDPVDNAPACLGFPYRPSWGPDDDFAMKKIIKQFEYQKEERLASIGN
jgi:tRNA A-37 threonylcarbamoyl transferase component Bud32